MMAARETITLKEEEGGADDEGDLEVGAASVEVDFTRGHLATSYTSLI